MRGRFITFEGAEGCGKSTHAEGLAVRLRQFGIAVSLTREPGGTPGAEAVRHVLLSGAAKPLGPYAEAILFAAARDDHVRYTIEPALSIGKWVVSDRFVDSTRVYQGTVGSVDERVIYGLERITIGDLLPDLTFVLDVPADVGLARAKLRRGTAPADRFEGEKLDFHERLRDAFRMLALTNPNRCVLVDATEARAAVAERIWKVVSERLDPATAPIALESLKS